MNFEDHDPPHFHAKYGEYHIAVNIMDGIVQGVFPKRSLRLVLEWYDLHKAELLADWDSVRATGEFAKIAPLE